MLNAGLGVQPRNELPFSEYLAMQPRFAVPTERDLRFVRQSGFRSEDFGQEVRIIDSVVDGVVIIAMLIGLLSVLAVMA